MATISRRDHNRVEWRGISPGRLVAVHTLYRVATDGAYASLVLDTEIQRTGTKPRDAALATEVVYGSLRILPELDQAISNHLKNDLSKMDRFTLSALRTAVYQLNHLARIPSYAVVNDTVNIIRTKRGARLSGFANAVLRKLAEKRPQHPEIPKRLSLPQWLETTLKKELDREQYQAFIENRQLPPPLCLRINHRLVDRQRFIDTLQAQLPAAKVIAGDISPLSILIQKGGNPRHLPGYDQGLFSIQEEGSQLVGLMAGARNGERIADVCAGHGGKTTLLSSLVGPGGWLTAIDINEDKLDSIINELSRLKMSEYRVDREPIDLTVGTAGYGAIFDRVIVDAPCTGLGTIHRRPDLLLRVGPGDPFRMSEIQKAILSRAVALVRKKGQLLYSVCSPMPQEGIQVARLIEEKYPNLRRISPPSTVFPWPQQKDQITRIGPWMNSNFSSSPDVYQVIQWIVG